VSRFSRAVPSPSTPPLAGCAPLHATTASPRARRSSIDRYQKSFRRCGGALVVAGRPVVEAALIAPALTQIKHQLHRIGPKTQSGKGRYMIIRIVASALTAAVMLGAAAAPAIAEPVVVTATNPDDVVSRDVSYRDLNLASAAGEQALVKRVRHVVSDVCTEAVGGSRGYLLDQSDSCKDASWQGASLQIDRAVQRARDIAANGWSAIAPVAIRISVQ